MLSVGVENLPEIDQFPLWAELYVEHEREAITLSLYANQALPGPSDPTTGVKFGPDPIPLLP